MRDTREKYDREHAQWSEDPLYPRGAAHIIDSGMSVCGMLKPAVPVFQPADERRRKCRKCLRSLDVFNKANRGEFWAHVGEVSNG